MMGPPPQTLSSPRLRLEQVEQVYVCAYNIVRPLKCCVQRHSRRTISLNAHNIAFVIVLLLVEFILIHISYARFNKKKETFGLRMNHLALKLCQFPDRSSSTEVAKTRVLLASPQRTSTYTSMPGGPVRRTNTGKCNCFST